MTTRILKFESTPNPNAVKCILDRTVSDRPRSYLNAEAAIGDPLAEPFFALQGIRNILVNGDWISVNKLDDAKWSTLKPALRKVVATLPTSS